MSAESNQSSGESSLLHLPTPSRQSTQTSSSEEEDAKAEEENSKEDSPFSEEEEYLEENEDQEEEQSLEKDDSLEEETSVEEDDSLEEEQSLEEDEYLEGGKSLEENDYLEDGKSVEEDDSLEEEKYLKGKEYLHEQESLRERNYLQKEKGLIEKKDLSEEEYLEREFKVSYSSQTSPDLNERSPVAGVSRVTTLLAHPPPIFEPDNKSLYSDMRPSIPFMKDGESLSWRDQGTQTDCTYETKAPAKLKLKRNQEGSTTILSPLQVDSEVTKFVSQRNFLDGILNEPTDTLEVEDSDENDRTLRRILRQHPCPRYWHSHARQPYSEAKRYFSKQCRRQQLFKSSYESVFRTMVKEMAARNELEEDIDIPLTGHLESETRRKLGILLKRDFQKYKETIQWIMKKRENLFSFKTSETVTYSFHILSRSPQIEEPETEVQKPPTVRPKRKTLEIDTEWMKSDIEVHQDDVKLILYPNENIFRILFPDGSGQIHYPSGNLAMLILSTKENKFTYIILEDTKDDEETCVRALINNTGHATFYDENREIWLSLSQNLGYYFAKDKPQKAWNWWDLGLHVHAPPVRSISLDINQHIRVQVRSQDQVTFCFIHPSKHVCLNLGTKYKFIPPEMLNEMKNKATLEVEFGSTAQKIQILLAKMSKILNFLTICDLESFLEDTSILLMDDVGKSVRPQTGGAHSIVPGLLQDLLNVSGR